LTSLGSVAVAGLETVLMFLVPTAAHAPGTQNNFAIDEKLRLDDGKIENLTENDSPVKRHFEDNAKHGPKRRGNASKAPANPQDVLDNSFELPGNTSRRIGIDYKTYEFNVFDEHAPGKFHGHVRTYKELSPQMQSLLRKEGLVNKKGKIKPLPSSNGGINKDKHGFGF